MVQEICIWVTFEYISPQCTILYEEVTQNKMSVTAFWETLFYNLFKKDEIPSVRQKTIILQILTCIY